MSVENLVKAYQELSGSEKEQFLSMVLQEKDELSPEWKEEISRRWEAYKAGESLALDALEVDKMLAQKYGLSL